MAIGDVPLTPIIDTVTGSVTEIGRIFLRTLTAAVNGLAPIDATYWVSRAAGVLSAEVNLGKLPSGYLKINTAVGEAVPATVVTIPQADVTGLPAALAGKATLPIAQSDVTNLTADLALKAPLASPALTGTPTAPTAAPGTNTTQIATTALVQGGLTAKANVAGGNAFTGAQSIAGVLTVNGLGAHSFTGTGAGPIDLMVRNASAGAGNQTRFAVGNDTDAYLTFLASFSSTFTATGFQTPNGTLLFAGGSGGLSIYSAANVRLFSSGTERMRIAPTGELLVNLTTTGLAGQINVATDLSGHQGLAIQNTNAGNAGNFVVFFNSASGTCGNITQTGATTILYGATSDARLKTDAGPAVDLAALRAVVVHDFTWTADGRPDRGVFAQDVAALFPRAVVAGTDERTADGSLARPWMTDYSKFVADLIVGWQQHDATIADLRAELADLRARLADRRS